MIFLNLWATSYGPCLAEIPALGALYAKLGQDSRFAFLAVSKDDAPTLKRFLAKRKLSFPVYRLPEGSEIDGTGTAVPVTLIIDEHGKVLTRILGAADWTDEAFLADLRRAIAQVNLPRLPG